MIQVRRHIFTLIILGSLVSFKPAHALGPKLLLELYAPNELADLLDSQLTAKMQRA